MNNTVGSLPLAKNALYSPTSIKLQGYLWRLGVSITLPNFSLYMPALWISLPHRSDLYIQAKGPHTPEVCCIIAERLSARQLILRRISEIVCMYVCMYVSVTLRNSIISRATRKRSITCASVTPRNVTAVPAMKSAGRSPLRTTIVRDVGDALRTQRSGSQPEYEPIRAACNRLAQLSICTYLLQRRCNSGERRVRST